MMKARGIWIWRRGGDGNWKVARAIGTAILRAPASSPARAPRSSDDFAAINKLLDHFVGAVNAGDVEAWGDLMTEDTIFAVPDAPRFIGRENAVAAAKAGFFDSLQPQARVRFEDVQLFGTQGFAHGVFTMDLMPKAGGKGLSLPGKFTNFFRKENDGSWENMPCRAKRAFPPALGIRSMVKTPWAKPCVPKSCRPRIGTRA